MSDNIPNQTIFYYGIEDGIGEGMEDGLADCIEDGMAEGKADSIVDGIIQGMESHLSEFGRGCLSRR